MECYQTKVLQIGNLGLIAEGLGEYIFPAIWQKILGVDADHAVVPAGVFQLDDNMGLGEVALGALGPFDDTEGLGVQELWQPEFGKFGGVADTVKIEVVKHWFLSIFVY